MLQNLSSAAVVFGTLRVNVMRYPANKVCNTDGKMDKPKAKEIILFLLAASFVVC